MWLSCSQTTHISCIFPNLLNLIYFDLICLISFSPQYSSFIWQVIIRCKYGFHDCADFLNYQKSPVSFSFHVLYAVSADEKSGLSFTPIIFRKCQNNFWLVKKAKHNCLGSILPFLDNGKLRENKMKDSFLINQEMPSRLAHTSQLQQQLFTYIL